MVEGGWDALTFCGGLGSHSRLRAGKREQLSSPGQPAPLKPHLHLQAPHSTARPLCPGGGKLWGPEVHGPASHGEQACRVSWAAEAQSWDPCSLLSGTLWPHSALGTRLCVHPPLRGSLPLGEPQFASAVLSASSLCISEPLPRCACAPFTDEDTAVPRILVLGLCGRRVPSPCTAFCCPAESHSQRLPVLAWAGAKLRGDSTASPGELGQAWHRFSLCSHMPGPRSATELCDFA